jgi:hypothetical protein
LAASTYDRAHAPVKHQPTRSAERTDIWDANVTESFHEAYEFGFDIDTPTDIVQAHMHDQSGVIPKETFGQLLPESRKAWSQLSDDVPVDILRALQANGSQRSQESTRTPSLHDKPRYNQTRVPLTRLACNRAIESSYWRMDNNSDVGLLTGYVLYRLPIELESMDLDTFSR